MALSSVVAALLLALALARVHVSTSLVVKGSVSCLDCTPAYHSLSGVKLAVKCDRDQRMAFALTDENGSFKAQLPLSSSREQASSEASNCLAMILGGPRQLCSSKKAMSTKIIKAHGSDSFTTDAPLTFSITCPSKTKNNPVESSKTIDLPLPPEWGLPPTSSYLYVPFFPIIGVP
ncbi:hypothetical protein ACLOJK_005895 [Asimina triloba]